MFFKFNSDSFNSPRFAVEAGQISKGYAKGLFIVGLLLIGFGTLVWILKEVLAVIAAAIFVIVGVILCFNAVRIFINTMKTNKDDSDGRSDNVRIRIEKDNSEI